jgi:hypothetical protein
MLVNYWSRVRTTPSLRQGHYREEGSEGSQRQICESTNRNVIEGRDSWASWHNTTKPDGSRNTVNDAVVQRQFTHLIRGGLSSGGQEGYGSRTEGCLERDREPTESYGHPDSTVRGNPQCQAGQKSAETIVAANAVKGRTSTTKEEP